MEIYLHNKDILDITEADTIVLPIDASGPGMEGNIARKFLERVGFDKLQELYAPPPYYPFNGSAHWSSISGLEETHFEWLCAAGVLSHAPDANHQGFARSALAALLTSADLGSMGTRIACPVFSGGWRNDPMGALYMMLGEAERFSGSQLQLHIAEKDTNRYNMFRPIVGE